MVISEQFGTLEALFPGRIDLGLGRAPGSDQRVARALRRTLASDERQFPQDVLELQAFLAGDEQLGITAVPGAGTHNPLWLFGSSTFGAQLAAMLGLPYAFATPFAPDALDEPPDIYRRPLKTSAQLAKHYTATASHLIAPAHPDKAQPPP